jgi:hypothetical protein
MRLPDQTGAARHPLRMRGADCYETPVEAVHALLAAEKGNVPPFVWEPCCATCNVAGVLRSAGIQVWATDLIDYGSPQQNQAGVDFLLESRAPDGCLGAISNPPYQLATQFIEHAIGLVPYTAMLLRLCFIEGIRRSHILDRHLARIHVFANRLPRMHRRGWEGPRATSQVAFAWFVFLRDYGGPIVLDRVMWRRFGETAP